MDATLILDEIFNGVMTIDVGRATTDVHSVSDPKSEYAKYHDGKPRFKRTVEGDLGVYINRLHVINTFRTKELENLMKLSMEAIIELAKNEPFIPESKEGQLLFEVLTKQCVHLALDRHIGDLKRVFTTNGMKVIPEGKDTTQVKAIFYTGGALLNSNQKDQIIRDYLSKSTTKLIPDVNTKVYYDHDYIFASLGVLSQKYREQARKLIKQSIRLEGESDVT
jgi:uncharacterized protein (TIGR01319 family)